MDSLLAYRTWLTPYAIPCRAWYFDSEFMSELNEKYSIINCLQTQLNEAHVRDVGARQQIDELHSKVKAEQCGGCVMFLHTLIVQYELTSVTT